MFHHVGFQKRDHTTGLKGDDVDVHVVPQIGGVDKARRGPGAICVGHDAGGDVRFIGDQDLGGLKAGYGDIGLADPVKAQGLRTGVRKLPLCARGQVGIAAGGEGVGGPIHRERRRAVGDKEDGLGRGLRLGLIRTAAGGYLHQIVRKRLGKARHGPRDHPKPGAGPKGQGAGGDVTHRAFGNDGIGLREDGAIRQQLRLWRMPPCGGVVGAGHLGSVLSGVA